MKASHRFVIEAHNKLIHDSNAHTPTTKWSITPGNVTHTMKHTPLYQHSTQTHQCHDETHATISAFNTNTPMPR